MTPTEEWIARGRVPFIRHFTATTQIDVLSETQAKARSYYLFLTVHGLDHWGRYLDEFAPVDGPVADHPPARDHRRRVRRRLGCRRGRGRRRRRPPHPAPAF